jgi:hypothetical protein
MEENREQLAHFPTGNKEIVLLAAAVLLGILTANCGVYFGLNLGFAVAAVLCIGVSWLYLHKSGCKMTPYSGALLALSMAAAASHARSDDGFVKFVMLMFTLVSANLGLCLMAGQNRRSAGGFTSLLDAPRAVFTLGLGGLGNAGRGIKESAKNAGPAGKNRTAVLVGVLIAVPVMAVLIPLLISADAAFEGLLALLPDFDLAQAFGSVILGVPLAAVLYARNVALRHREKEESAVRTRKTIHPLTVNTVLIAVCVLYLAYLFSQLSYFVGGFAGLLPEDYTMADYARRGFFEMAWLSVLNLGIMTLSVALAEPKNGRAPLMTRLLALFVGAVSTFFIGTASAKMMMYIGSYGLTRLRLLTEVIMVFIAFTVVYVTVWLFCPRFPYMKAVVLTGLLIGCVVAWADVDTMVAAYNVHAYQSGALESIDIGHLGSLGDGAVPYIAELRLDRNLTVARWAQNELESRILPQDIRGKNIAGIIAEAILEQLR